MPQNNDFDVFYQDDLNKRQIYQQNDNENENENEQNQVSALDSTKGLMSLLSAIRRNKNNS